MTTAYIPDLQTQLDFEELYSKNKLMGRIRKEFDVPEVREHCKANEIPEEFGIDLMCQMTLFKRAKPEVLIGVLYRHFEDEENPFTACSAMLDKAIEANLVKYSYTSGTVVIKIEMTDDIYEDLKRYQFPLPLLVQPKPVTKNSESGYYSFNTSMLLSKGNHHDDDICLDHIARVNNVALTINKDTVDMVANNWSDLDKQKPDETKEEFLERKKAFKKYDEASRDVMKHVITQGNKFYLTHRYDTRGRQYCQGYHVNYQGTEWNKAVVEFYNKETVNVKV